MTTRMGKAALAVILCASLVVPAGCMTKGSKSPSASPGAKDGTGMSSGGGATLLDGGAETLPVSEQKGTRYLEANRLVSLLGMESKWDPSAWTYDFGDKDATYSVKVGDSAASKDGEPVQLTEAPTLIGSSVYLPVSALAPLLGEELRYQVEDGQVRVLPNADGEAAKVPDREADGTVPSELNFADDPADPFKDNPMIRSLNGQTVLAPQDGESAIVAAAGLKNIDMPVLIHKAYQYLGAPYIFGANSYAATGGFDCSLYTQYIYGKFGISLPRLARQQARVGVLVSRTSMRVGDLVFFYIPGRFKSNKIVGHVGIYIGNGKMINADNLPKKGVQITNINKPYWKKTFISAKRVAS